MYVKDLYIMLDSIFQSLIWNALVVGMKQISELNSIKYYEYSNYMKSITTEDYRKER